MSAKKKKSVSPWVQCDKCGVIASDRDISKHSCATGPGQNSYPFVQNKSLHCSLNIFKSEDSAIGNIPKELMDSLVLLSNAALQLCEIPVGDSVVVSSLNGSDFIRMAWKAHDRQQLTASLSENDVAALGLSEGNAIAIRPLSEAVDVARDIILEGEADRAENSEVLALIQQSFRNRTFCVGNRLSISYFGKKKMFKILEISGFNASGKFFKALPETVWRMSGAREDEEDKRNLLCRIGGLHPVIEEAEEILAGAMGASSGLDILKTRGLLLYGPNGTGKTLLMNALAHKWAKTVVNVIIRPDDDINTQLEQCFSRAQSGAPSIIILDDLDLFCGKSSQERQTGSTLAGIFDRLHCSKSQIVIIATTSNVNQVDRSLRRPGRFDKELEVGVPTPTERLEVLKALLVGKSHKVADEDLKTVADKAHGFVGADLAAMLSKAATLAVKKGLPLQGSDILLCLPIIRPSAMREIMVQVPDVRWEDIGGQKELKHQLRQAVEWPLKYPESFVRLGVSPPRGVLMYGPPGCSKTMVAKALATESGLNFISVKGPELFSKWVGESEKAVREVFRRARLAAPSIVFFDELDALAGERTAASGGAQVQERVLAQLLTELDGVEALGHVIVVGATNRPDRIDQALLRPGRLDRVVYVPLPDRDTRSDIFRIQFRKTPIAEDVSISELADLTDRYSGAEVVAVCNEAAMFALDEDMESCAVERRHFMAALNVITPRTPESYLQLCERYRNRTIKM